MEWIPVEKELPPGNKLLICSGMNGGVFLGHYVGLVKSKIPELGKRHSVKVFGGHSHIRGFLAWMPAPEPYVDLEAQRRFTKILCAYNESHKYKHGRPPRKKNDS